MNYVEYEQDTGLVLEIHKTQPEVVRENCLIIENNSLQIGMESAYNIIIEQILNNGKLVVNCTLKPEINNSHFSERISSLETEKEILQETVESNKLDINNAIEILIDKIM